MKYQQMCTSLSQFLRHGQKCEANGQHRAGRVTSVITMCIYVILLQVYWEKLVAGKENYTA
ncbi:hypothetical protein B7P43_G00592 [Cryptotermes secundus]|uniref:Uncharacterized protein n=1 Tax=Cryptotermes secundus TaxID=105785 RepID=A0A2J7Q6F0_9NEOP|nr:hypothetical protein B7P43_G00592 [Cryptotermes secundus]